MKNLFLFLSIFLFQSAFSQQPKILKLKNYRVAYLSDSLKETSGLSFFNGKPYTFNDGNNTSEIFEIDKKTGKILSKIKIDLKNEDWEALTNDGENFYIGDFGNNFGTRKNLKIYKVPFSNQAVQKDSIEIISFKYSDQTDFSPKSFQTDFDAEAMIFSPIDNLLHIFTKEWKSKNISHYLVDPLNFSTEQSAKKWETAKLGFMATDACLYGKNLFVVGYTKKTEVFLAVFTESESDGSFFKNPPQKFYLGSALSISQIEGIAVDDDGIYISGEEFRTPLGTAKQSFYFIPKEELK